MLGGMVACKVCRVSHIIPLELLSLGTAHSGLSEHTFSLQEALINIAL